MSIEWDYPCYQYIDDSTELTIQSPRNTHGMFWSLGSPHPTTFPFTDEITLFFSFLVRSGNWSAVDTIDNRHGILSMAKAGASHSACNAGLLLNPSSPFRIQVRFEDNVANATRYDFQIGDENGVDWIQTDKMYQVGISANATRFQYVVNGSTTPKVIVNTDSPGALQLGDATRYWVGHNGAAWGHTPILNNPLDYSPVTSGFSTLLTGPMMAHSTAIDLSDAAVRARIWDEDGNFKNPGEDGSLWYSDTYGLVKPFNYFLNGSGNRDNGTSGQRWIAGARGQWWGFPAGLKKQYGTPIPA